MRPRSKSRHLRAASALLSLGAIAGLLASGSEAKAQEDHAASRRLGDTTFLLPALADSAFILTEFGLRQGVTYEQIGNFPVGSIGRYPLQWAELDEQIDFAIRIFDSLGVYTQLDGSGTIGLDMPSLVFAGGGYAYSGKAGIAGRVAPIEQTRPQMTVRAYGQTGSGRTLDLLGLFGAVSVREGRDLQRIVAEPHNLNQLPQLVENELLSLANTNYNNIVLTQTSSSTLGASIHIAQGIVGLVATAP